jgi:hypothetical protein
LPFALQLTYYEFAKEELEQLDNGMSASSMTTSSSDSADDTGQGTPDDHRGQDQQYGESARSLRCVLLRVTVVPVTVTCVTACTLP